MKTFYTKNICTNWFVSIELFCNAVNKTEAFYKFKEYLEKKKFNEYTFQISIKDIKELKENVKSFFCEG